MKQFDGGDVQSRERVVDLQRPRVQRRADAQVVDQPEDDRDQREDDELEQAGAAAALERAVEDKCARKQEDVDRALQLAASICIKPTFDVLRLSDDIRLMRSYRRKQRSMYGTQHVNEVTHSAVHRISR